MANGAIRRAGRSTDLTDVLLVVGFWLAVTAWAIWPYRRLLQHLDRSWTVRRGNVVVGVAAVVVVGLGANSFLMTSALVGGSPHPTADGVTILLVPVLQWAVVGSCSAVLTYLNRARTGGVQGNRPLQPTSGGKGD
jgi:hypothetical protein